MTTHIFDFSPEVTSMLEHLDWCFKDKRGYLALGLWHVDTGKMTEHSYHWPRESGEVYNFVKRNVSLKWTEVLYCPILRKTKNTRAKGDATSHSLLWADVDTQLNPETKGLLKGWGARIVSTGRPGARHIYLRLNKSLSAEVWESYQRSLKEMVNGDPKVADNDFLKLPGSWNYKNHPNVPERKKLSAPALSFVEHNGRTVKNLTEILTPVATPVAKAKLSYKDVPVPNKIPDYLRHYLSEQSQGDGTGRFKKCHHIVRTIAEAGYTLDQAHAMLKDYSPGVDKFSYRWHNQITDIWAKWQAEQPIEPDTLWDKRPELKHIWTSARNQQVSPWSTLGMVLLRISHLTPHYVTLPRKGSLNLFVLMVGASGQGKGESWRVARHCVDVGADIESATLGSGEGLAGHYRYVKREGKTETVAWRQRSVLVYAPEADTWAELITRNGATLDSQLRSAWSGEPLGFSNKDKATSLVVPEHEYRFGLGMGMQPTRTKPLFERTSGGTPQRFLWLSAAYADVPEWQTEAPEPMVWALPDFSFEGHYEIPFCHEADEEMSRNRFSRVTDISWEGSEDLDSHTHLMTRKVAAHLMLLNGRIDKVTSEDWELAKVVVAESDRVREKVRAKLMAAAAKQRRVKAASTAKTNLDVERFTEAEKEKRIERISSRIVSKLEDNGGSMGKRVLTREFAVKERDMVGEALDIMREDGEIRFVQAKQGGVKVVLVE